MMFSLPGPFEKRALHGCHSAVEVLEYFEGCRGHVQCIEVNAANLVVNEFLDLVCCPFNAD